MLTDALGNTGSLAVLLGFETADRLAGGPGHSPGVAVAEANGDRGVADVRGDGLPCPGAPARDEPASAFTSRSGSPEPPGAPELDIGARTRNALQRSLRCLGERGFALLSQHWRTLQHVTAGPRKIGDIAQAALVLTHFEYGHIT